ncbi:acyltransferase domain-containing protein [Streptantibioticus silvisoli]|uniref:acyltransferase domain-containing protein n=1 Tax=Streptantibioticus silvisoli TaxID=2705255 RepID=UPI0026E57D32
MGQVTRTTKTRGTREARPTRRIGFLLPGQGAQHQRMAAGLYGWDDVFTTTMDTLFAALGTDGGTLRADWLSDDPAVPPDHVTRAQPLLYAVDYAIGATLRAWGAPPAVLLGHSAGELAAGALAGVFDPADAMRLMWDRARRIAALPPGGMLAVAATVEELTPWLHGDVVIAAVNGPRQTMLAGPAAPLAEALPRIREAGLTAVPVKATTAFHSPALRPAISTEPYQGVTLRPPAVALWSAFAAAPLTVDLALSPRFWAGHPVEPVLFGPALDALLTGEDLLLIETGPGQGLTSLARRHPRVRAGHSAVVPLLPARPLGPRHDRRHLLAAVDRLRDQGWKLNPPPAPHDEATDPSGETR